MKVFSVFELNNSRLYYVEKNGRMGLILLPKNAPCCFDKNCAVEPLVQLKIFGDNGAGGFGNGLTMRNSGSLSGFKFVKQQVLNNTIITTLQDARKFVLEHHVVLLQNAVEVFTKFINNSNNPVRIEMLTSFNIGALSPYQKENTTNTLLHRIQSFWAAEGKLKTDRTEQLMLEPAWMPIASRVEKFGCIGSMPVRRYFPFAAIEDTQNKVIWGVQLYCNSSWQIEVGCYDNGISLGGGLADYEYGHWYKSLNKDESFVTPKAVLAVCEGGIDDITNILVEVQKNNLSDIPAIEEDLPIAFNEFCTTWGEPTIQNIKDIANKLNGRGITYFTIDAGWYREDAGLAPNYDVSVGDWEQSKWLFPNGIIQAADYIKSCGMIPGIWFEFETVGLLSRIAAKKEWLLTRDSSVISTDRRKFLDMRNPQVTNYLDNKVIEFIKENGFGYLKVDYNDSIGIGCDGAESLGEGLRQTLEASKEYFKRIKKEIPELVIENCSSGGHRLEPSMMSLVSQASFSDAHEGKEIPVIAANLHRAIHPIQNQIWAVLHAEDSNERLFYSLASTFLGRMCLSGDIHNLSDNQWEITDSAIALYKQVSHIIKNGRSYRYGEPIPSYVNPSGHQVMVREFEGEALIVAHCFDVGNERKVLELGGNYKLIKRFGCEEIELNKSVIEFPSKSFRACVFWVEKV